jgi:acyl carrier protein
MSNPRVSESEILARFAPIVANSLRITPDRVTADAYLSDLGAESLDLLEITMDTEDEFGVVMPQSDILHVGQEVFGQDVLVRDGVLTAEGARFLQRRLTFDSAAITAGMPVADVVRIFQRVATWVRVIQGLIEHSPTQCPSCGSSLAKPLANRVRCTSCDTEVDLPAGDDLNRRWVEEYYRAETAQAGSAQAATAEH